jgi:uncharacterized protein YecE (DUF72 family)
MMSKIGTSDLPHGVGWERYFSRLSFIETSILAAKNARPSVLAKWRAAAPDAGSFSIIAPPLGTPLPKEAELLEPDAVVWRTAASFSPSAHNREVLRAHFAALPPAPTRVWQPDGLWDLRTALKLANEMDVVLGVDPLVRDQTRDPPDLYTTLETEALYCRVTGLGRGTRKLPSSQLEELAEVAQAYPRTWMVFATTDSLTDATRLAELLPALQK